MNRRGVYQLELAAGAAVLAGMIVVALLALSGIIQPSRPSSDWKPPGDGSELVQTRSRKTDPPQYVGLVSGGCATSNCHGGHQSPNAVWKISAFVFQQQDPHTQAFEVLFEERSREMIRWLTRSGTEQRMQDTAWYLQQLEARCVSCHATPLPESIGKSSKDAGVEFAYQHYAQGVSCEACHGPASQWVHEHLSASWSPGPEQQENRRQIVDKESFGFHDLEQLPSAARTCAGCHLGAPGVANEPPGWHEVTHDLIAAGHPRLDFEFSAWYASVPPHWDSSRELRPDFHTDAWIHGQTEALRSRARLVTGQAQHRSGLELANFDCFACHHSLRVPSAFSTGAGIGLEGSQLTFGSCWKVFQQLHSEQVDRVNQEITDSLTQHARSGEPRQESRQPAWVSFGPPKGLTPQTLASELADYPQPIGDGQERSIASWDELVSWYYAAAAVLRDAEFEAQSSPEMARRVEMTRLGLDDLRREMEQMLGGDPEGPPEKSRYASPRRFVAPATWNSPEIGDRSMRINATLEAVRTALRSLWKDAP